MRSDKHSTGLCFYPPIPTLFPSRRGHLKVPSTSRRWLHRPKLRDLISSIALKEQLTAIPHTGPKIIMCQPPMISHTQSSGKAQLSTSNTEPIKTRISAQCPHPAPQAILVRTLRAEKLLGLLARLSFLPCTQPKGKTKRQQRWGGPVTPATAAAPHSQSLSFLPPPCSHPTAHQDGLKMAG